MPRPATKPIPAPQVEKLLYRRKDAAFALSLSLRTIDRLISEKALITRRVGKCVVIPAADIKRFAAHVLRCDMLQGTAPRGSEDSNDEGSRSVRAPEGQPHLVVPVLRPRETA